MVVEHWSRDGRYLYLQPEFCCIDGPGLLFTSNYALYKLELPTGEFTAILSPFFPYAFSFSPDDKYFTYINSDIPKIIHLTELETGSTYSVLLNEFYEDAGNMVWTPDSKEFVFVAAENGWLDIESPVFTIFLYNVANKSLQVLLDDHRQLYPSSEGNDSYWVEENVLLFREAFGNDGVWKLNIRTKEFAPYSPQ